MMRSSCDVSRKTVPVGSKDAGAATSRPGVLFVLVVLLMTLATGCTPWREYFANGFKVGPNYCRPAACVADQWIDEKDEADAKDTQDGIGKDCPLSTEPVDDVAWWRTFDDPVLDYLVDSAYRQNLTLRIAGLRILEARSQMAIAAGNLFPQSQEAFGDYTRTGLSKNSLTGQFFKRFRGEWRLGTSMAWELDFWGRFRRAIEAADANLDAAVENYDDVLVLLVSEVAQSYTQVRIAEQRLAYAQKNVEIQQGSLRLADERYRNGATTKLDVTQAQSNLAQTEASMPPLESARRQAVNQLCVLLGMPPQSLDDTLTGHNGIPTAPPQVAIGIPAELLRRRPDIRRAEREVAAQSALIGVATADLYPYFSITGTIYLDALRFKNLFAWDSVAGSVGPSFHWNILNYGRLAHNIRVQETRFQQLAVQYQQVVLQANAEAENAIVRFLKSQQQVRSLEASEQAAAESVELVSLQYKEGKVDFNRVFSNQELLTLQQDKLAVAQGDVAQNLIELYRALGGGWEIRLTPNVSQPAAEPQPVEAMPTPVPDVAPPLQPPAPPAVTTPG